EEGREYAARFHAAMEEDFNTPKAFAELSALATAVNRARAAGETARANALAGTLRELGGILGLFQADPEEYLKQAAPEAAAGALDDAQIEALVARRSEARRQRNWAESDRIRDELKRAGIILEDSPQATTWRRA